MTDEQKLKEAMELINKIASQAICVNMDGDEGNEQFLIHISNLCEEFLRKTNNEHTAT